MSTLDDTLTDMGATLFCKGQDWEPGDGSASEIDGVCDKAKQQVTSLMLEIYGEALKGKTIAEMGDIFRKEVNEL